MSTGRTVPEPQHIGRGHGAVSPRRHRGSATRWVTSPMARLVLGPLLRHVTDTSATIWVETDAPCTVEVLGQAATTFTVS